MPRSPATPVRRRPSPAAGPSAVAGAGGASAVPAVVVWYGRYCQAAIALFSLASLIGVRIVWSRASFAAAWEVEPGIAGAFGALLTLTLAFFAFVHFAALRTPRSQWAWKIHAIVLGIGLTTLVLWPAAVPLLWYWLKPETRRFFGVPTARGGRMTESG